MSSSSAENRVLEVVDSHTGGEPTRVVVSGGPDLGQGTMAQRRQCLAESHDWVRTALVNEPRGSDVMVGAILCEPLDPKHAAGVVFFNNAGYLNMCGHGMIGVVVTLSHLGRIGPGRHVIETPVGLVTAELHGQQRVTIENVPSYRSACRVRVDVPGHGAVLGDVAWGGNWFFLIGEHDQQLSLERVDQLVEWTWAVRQALVRQGVTGDDGGEIDHIEVFGPPTDPALADSRSFVLCPGRAYDRSPCGTGTSAKLACLAADGKLAEGDVWRQQSIIGSVFEGSFRRQGEHIVPTITGTAFVNAETRVLIDPADPYACGIPSHDPSAN